MVIITPDYALKKLKYSRLPQYKWTISGVNK